MITLPDDYRARVAAEVAARYGVQCKPEVVQHVERGTTSQPRWVWDGKQLVPVQTLTDATPGHALRAATNARWAGIQRKKRLDAAKAAETGTVVRGSSKQAASAEARAAVAARAAERAADVARFAEGGKTLEEIGAHMGVGTKAAREYCKLKGIAWVAKPRSRPVVVMTDGLRSEMAKLAETMTSKQIADALGITHKAAQQRLYKFGLTAKRPPPAKPFAKGQRTRAGYVPCRAVLDAKQAEIAARREKVRELTAQGLTDRLIGEALGMHKSAVRRDRRELGIKVRSSDAVKKRLDHGMGAVRAKRDARDTQVRNMRADGMTVEAMAKALSCGVATVSATLSRLGLTQHGMRGNVGDPLILARVQALASKGLTRVQIAAELGMARSTVQRVVDRLRKLAAVKEAA